MLFADKAAGRTIEDSISTMQCGVSNSVEQLVGNVRLPILRQNVVDWAYCSQSKAVFRRFHHTIPANGRLDQHKGAKRNYVLNRNRSKAHRKRPKEIHILFSFIKAIMLEAQPSGPSTRSPDNILLQVLVTLTGHGNDSNGVRVRYSATLVIRPSRTSVHEHRAIPQVYGPLSFSAPLPPDLRNCDSDY